jgi:hypothetical protein
MDAAFGAIGTPQRQHNIVPCVRFAMGASSIEANTSIDDEE